MFSAADAKEVFRLLSTEGNLNNSLILASSGNGFVTRKYAYQTFEQLVTKDTTHRLSLSSLAYSLDVDVNTIHSLVDGYDGTLVLQSGKAPEIITKRERDAIHQEIEAIVLHGVVSKAEFARKHDLSQTSLEKLISLSQTDIVEADGYLYSTSYDVAASNSIASVLKDHIEKLEVTNIESTNVPGTPPLWFISQTVKRLLEDPAFSGKIHVQENASGVLCTPVQLVKQEHDIVVNELQSGKTACLDINRFQHGFQVFYSSTEEALKQLEHTEGLEIQRGSAISKAWISKFSNDCVQRLTQIDSIDIRLPLKASFPESLHASLVDRVEKEIRASAPGITRVGDLILSESSHSDNRNALLSLAKTDATAQWNLLKGNSKTEARFSLSNIVSQIPDNRSAMRILVRERPIERALDDAFTAEIVELEKQNEADFAEFWTDRVATRAAMYTEGLTAVEDQKLQSQLSELLAQYVQKDLVPDAIAKASTRGLSLSRKTRKNIQRLETAFSAGNMDVSALEASLDKFNKKQSIDAPTPSALEASKATMLGDMARRMQKQKKSDGPLLFLTLVVFLFAKHNAGVIYATGKFAPRLLKQLKAKLDEDHFAQMEAWKEAAKAGTLSAEDRDAMKKMVEAQV